MHPQAAPCPCSAPALQGTPGGLAELQQFVATLAPAAAPPQGAPAGRERERLQTLTTTTRHVLTLPPGPVSADRDQLLRRAADLRERSTETLTLLAGHAEAELPAAIQRALRCWDQAGDVNLLSADGRRAAMELQASAQEALAVVRRATRREAALLGLLTTAAEATLAVDAACALLRAVETRFTLLLRARLQRSSDAQTAALLPGGVPFLDLAGALRAAAAAFAGSPAPPAAATAEPAPQGNPSFAPFEEEAAA